QDRYTTEIVGNEMQMLDSRNAMAGGAPGGDSMGAYDYPEASGAAAPARAASPAPAASPPAGSPPAQDPYDDDIPF
ncbi:MAG: single-stranded DNA-binding protein, partial [Pseudomonadota bacterium]